jgi:hypothetical protein
MKQRYRIGAGIAAALSLACSQGFAATAADFKFDFDYKGPVRFKVEGVTTECDSATETCFGGDVANSTPGVPGPGAGTYNETTFGIGRINEIRTDDGNSDLLWSPVSAGFEVVYLLYGIADEYIEATTNGFRLYNTGCQGGDCNGLINMDYYVVDSFDGFNTNGPGDRTGFDTYPAVTDGSLLMATIFDKFGITDPEGRDTATLIQDVQGVVLPTTGTGSFYASCDSGPACAGINNVYLDADGKGPGGASDFFGQFTLDSTPTGDWPGSIDDPVSATNVPAPSALLLIGSGLVGLGALRRRSRRSLA